MDQPSSDHTPRGLREWWASPPRAGMRRVISPWEYRHLRGFAKIHILGAGVQAGVALVILTLGGSDWKTYGWALGFLLLGLANLGFARWEIGIARSLS